jgi:hypothetical protein
MEKRVNRLRRKNLRKRKLVAFDVETSRLGVCPLLSIADPILPHNAPQVKALLDSLYNDSDTHYFDSDYSMRVFPSGQAQSISDFATVAATTQTPEFSQAFKEPPLPYNFRKYNRLG